MIADTEVYNQFFILLKFHQDTHNLMTIVVSGRLVTFGVLSKTIKEIELTYILLDFENQFVILIILGTVEYVSKNTNYSLICSAIQS